MNACRNVWLGLALALLAGCDSDDPASPGGSGAPAPVVLKCAVARVVQSSADLVPGPVARGTVGDIVIENNQLRIIIQKGGRNWYNISQFGGNIIDALPKAADGSLIGRDHFEEVVLGTNIESAPNYQSVTVANPGGENADGTCEPAIVRATGPDDLLDFVNGSTAIRDLTLQGAPLNFPPSADDQDLDATIQTDYTLEAGKRYVTIATTLTDDETDPEAQRDIYLVEYMNGSGEVEVFQHGYGFGEAFATAPCDLCNFAAYAGHEGGEGVSYGLIHKEAGSSSVSVSGVTVFLYGRDIVTVALTRQELQATQPESSPNYTIPAGGSLAFTRYFAVGDGDVASIVDVRNEIHSLVGLEKKSGLSGRVVQAGTDPPVGVPGAEIAMISSERDGFPPEHGPVFNVVNHFRTDAQGHYNGTFPPGEYTLEVNVPGRKAAVPATRAIMIAADATTVVPDFTVDAPTFIRVTVKDRSTPAVAIPAKVQLIRKPGSSGGPDDSEPRNRDCFGPPSDDTCSDDQNPLSVQTGFFGDPKADPLPPRIALAEFAVLDPGSGPVAVGDTGPLPIEPGDYTVVVSHGPRYGTFEQDVTVPAVGTVTVSAVLAEVVPTPGYIHGDFHVHSINSPDSEVTNRERMATYVAEGMDFFTPSDHDMRVDFAPVIADMGLGARIATAPGAEVTTFDYGHYNFWPVRIETDRPCDDFTVALLGAPCGDPDSGHSGSPKIGQGTVDWGGQAPLGKDFPSAGHFSLSPEAIFTDAADEPHHDGRTVVRQINHIDWHFGANTGGLSIDTGVDPPESSTLPAERRLAGDASTNLYSDNYHTLELIVGTDGLDGLTDDFYNENLGDWFNLLNQGRFRTAISNSDTHQRRVTSLETRNQIAVNPALLTNGRADIARINADPHTVGDDVRAGYSTMTNAPFLVVEATGDAGAKAGSAYSATKLGTQGKPLAASADDSVSLKIDVRSPLWAPYDQILVFVNGETVKKTNEFGVADSPPRYDICGPQHAINFTGPPDRVIAGTAPAQHYETSKTVTVTDDRDYWIVVMARGTCTKSPTMWPVVPNSYNPDNSDADVCGGDDLGIRAMAMSNPIYVDVDGGGWTKPGVDTTAHEGTMLPTPDRCPTPMQPP